MRLSTEPDRDDARAAAVLAAALDAGVDLLDTADAYAHSDADVGHNERLIAAAVAGRTVRVVTKGGLVRPDGAWLPDGRAKHLADAARASRDRLGAIDVYLLHAIDPRTPMATSVRALAKLRDAGVVRAIGLSNVGVHQLEQALAITAIEAVEVELGPHQLAALHGGLVALCERRGIELYAHRPLGGPSGVRRLAKDPELAAIATRLGASPVEVVLAWLRTLSPVIIPLPGATRVETARSAARVIELDADARAALAARWLDMATPAPARHGEVVMIVGMPAAGKSTLAASYVARGYARFNRDERGGSSRDLVRALERELATGMNRAVLDNTYPTRASRAPIVAAARRHGLPVRCVVLTTSLEQAQANAAARVLELHGRLLEPDELARAGQIAPNTQFRYRRMYEPPRAEEGFTIEEVAFARTPTQGRAAVIVELDDLVWRGRPRTAQDIELLPGAIEALNARHAAGQVLAATTWQPEPIDAPALDARLVELVGLPLAIARCTHPAGPPTCWCRKPMPGLALALARTYGLDLARSVHVGRGPADAGFAQRAGMGYQRGWG
jgi:aryl-alcohol dehydrogenase-like predicted oxidoreductase/phosphoglycolate phosphatase-like HAD superfamily hydrolase